MYCQELDTTTARGEDGGPTTKGPQHKDMHLLTKVAACRLAGVCSGGGVAQHVTAFAFCGAEVKVLGINDARGVRWL